MIIQIVAASFIWFVFGWSICHFFLIRRPQRLYVVGMISDSFECERWELQGVFDCVESAEAVCTTTRHFVGVVTLNEDVGIKRVEWTKAWYPMLARMPKGVA